MDGCKNPGTPILSISEMKILPEKSSMKLFKLVPFDLAGHSQLGYTPELLPKHQGFDYFFNGQIVYDKCYNFHNIAGVTNTTGMPLPVCNGGTEAGPEQCTKK